MPLIRVLLAVAVGRTTEVPIEVAGTLPVDRTEVGAADSVPLAVCEKTEVGTAVEAGSDETGAEVMAAEVVLVETVGTMVMAEDSAAEVRTEPLLASITDEVTLAVGSAVMVDSRDDRTEAGSVEAAMVELATSVEEAPETVEEAPVPAPEWLMPLEMAVPVVEALSVSKMLLISDDRGSTAVVVVAEAVVVAEEDEEVDVLVVPG